jgi:thioesterase III
MFGGVIMATFQYQRTIREIDLDFLGHVNHATYLSMLEEARWEMMAEQGYGFDTLRTAMISPVILGVNIQYRKEIRNREIVTITTNTTDPTQKIGSLEQEIHKENGQLAAKATVTYGVMDLKERKLISPPIMWLKALGVSIEKDTQDS